MFAEQSPHFGTVAELLAGPLVLFLRFLPRLKLARVHKKYQTLKPRACPPHLKWTQVGYE